MEQIFIELPDFQKVIHLFAVPYIVESSYRGMFYNVFNIDETEVEFEDIKALVLTKFFLMEKINRAKRGK